MWILCVMYDSSVFSSGLFLSLREVRWVCMMCIVFVAWRGPPLAGVRRDGCWAPPPLSAEGFGRQQHVV